MCPLCPFQQCWHVPPWPQKPGWPSGSLWDFFQRENPQCLAAKNTSQLLSFAPRICLGKLLKKKLVSWVSLFPCLSLALLAPLPHHCQPFPFWNIPFTPTLPRQSHILGDFTKLGMCSSPGLELSSVIHGLIPAPNPLHNVHLVLAKAKTELERKIWKDLLDHSSAIPWGVFTSYPSSHCLGSVFQ